MVRVDNYCATQTSVGLLCFTNSWRSFRHFLLLLILRLTPVMWHHKTAFIVGVLSNFLLVQWRSRACRQSWWNSWTKIASCGFFADLRLRAARCQSCLHRCFEQELSWPLLDLMNSESSPDALCRVKSLTDLRWRSNTASRGPRIILKQHVFDKQCFISAATFTSIVRNHST